MSNVQIIIEKIEFDYDIDSMCGAFSECRGATVHALVRKRNGTSVSMTFRLENYCSLHTSLQSIAESEWDKWLDRQESAKASNHKNSIDMPGCATI